MQRRKKVETYDDADAFLSPAGQSGGDVQGSVGTPAVATSRIDVPREPAKSPSTGNGLLSNPAVGRSGAEPAAPSTVRPPLLSSTRALPPLTVADTSRWSAAAPPRVNPVSTRPLSSAPPHIVGTAAASAVVVPLPAVANSPKPGSLPEVPRAPAAAVTPSSATAASSAVFSPLPVPPSLAPIKGMRRTPSAGILSALAAAESMSMAGQGGSSASLTLHSPCAPLPPLPEPLSDSLPAPPQPEQPPQPVGDPAVCATTFSVCSAPIFGASGGQSEFDAIAEEADFAGSFEGAVAGVPEPARGGQPQQQSEWADNELDLNEWEDVDGVAGMRPAQPWQPSPAADTAAVSQQQQLTPPASAAAAAPFEGDVGYTEAAVGTPVSFPEPEEDQAELAADSAGPGLPGAAEEQSGTGGPQENASAAPSTVSVGTSQAPGSTWWADGFCYYVSPDGWRYWWDEAAQQWQPHEYVGSSAEENGAAPAPADADAGDGAGQGQPAVEQAAAAVEVEAATAEPATEAVEWEHAEQQQIELGSHVAPSSPSPPAEKTAAADGKDASDYLMATSPSAFEAAAQAAGDGDDSAFFLGGDDPDPSAAAPVQAFAFGGEEPDAAQQPHQVSPFETAAAPAAMSSEDHAKQQQPWQDSGGAHGAPQAAATAPAYAAFAAPPSGGYSTYAPAAAPPPAPYSASKSPAPYLAPELSPITEVPSESSIYVAQPYETTTYEAAGAGGYGGGVDAPFLSAPSGASSGAGYGNGFGSTLSTSATEQQQHSYTSPSRPGVLAPVALPTTSAAAYAPTSFLPHAGFQTPPGAAVSAYHHQEHPQPQHASQPWAAAPVHQYSNPVHQHHAAAHPSELRPRCRFGKMTFGGRLLIVSPDGTISTHLATKLPADVLSVRSAEQTASLAQRVSLLREFPGPLGNSVNKDKVTAFIGKRKEACVAEEQGDAAGLYTLWSALETQALHPPGKAAGAAATAAAALPQGGAALHASLGDAALLAALHPMSGGPTDPAPHAPSSPGRDHPAALANVQGLALGGRQDEALQAALQSRQWPVALILANSLGLAEWRAAVEAYARQGLDAAAPLSTLCMVAAGAGGAAIPRPATQPEAAARVVAAWQHHASALVAARMPGHEAALEALAALLLGSGKIPQAHTCYVLAGLPLQYSDAAQHQFAMLGCSRAMAPRTYASLPAILRTELFTWSRTVGNAQQVPQFLAVLPYKLLHAQALAELGLLSQAAQYCSSVLNTLQGLGNKVPSSLLVCRAAAFELNDRLVQFAAARKVSLAGSFTAGALVSSVGKLLDRGISALIGGEGSSTKHSRSNSFAAEHHAVPGGGIDIQSRRSSMASLSGMGGSTSPATQHARSPSGASAQGLDAGGGGGAGAEYHHSRGNSQPNVLSNFMSRVASIKQLVAPPSDPLASRGAAAGGGGGGGGTGGGGGVEPENTFYYDHELKIWRERGVEPPPAPEEPPPPPTMTAWQPAGAAPGMQQSPQLQRGGVGRYANQLQMASPSAGGGAMGGLLPVPPAATFVPAGVAASYFTPPGQAGSQQQPHHSGAGVHAGAAPQPMGAFIPVSQPHAGFYPPAGPAASSAASGADGMTEVELN